MISMRFLTIFLVISLFGQRGNAADNFDGSEPLSQENDVDSKSPFLPMITDKHFSDKRYKLGDEYDRKIINSSSLSEFSEEFQKLLISTVKVGSASGILLGSWKDYALVATSKHSLRSKNVCEIGLSVRMPLLFKDQVFRCRRLLASWDSVDFALIAVGGLNPDQLEIVRRLEKPHFASKASSQDSSLSAIGFGLSNNPEQELSVSYGDDCRFYTTADRARLQKDLDTQNPIRYPVWSQVLGCDLSHGDSGAPVVDLTDGSIQAFVWTGKDPKAEFLQNDDGLKSFVKFSNEDQLYNELNLAVPVSKIRNVISSDKDKDNFYFLNKNQILNLLQ